MTRMLMNIIESKRNQRMGNVEDLGVVIFFSFFIRLKKKSR